MSTFVLLLSVQADITHTGTDQHCQQLHLSPRSVDRVHGFGNIRHVHSRRQDGSGILMLVSSVTYMRATLRANETQYEFHHSHSSKINVPSPYSALTRFLTKPPWLLSFPVVSPASFPLPPLCLIEHLLQYQFRFSRCVLGETGCKLVPCVDPLRVCLASCSS